MKEYTAEMIWASVEYDGGREFKNKVFVIKDDPEFGRCCICGINIAKTPGGMCIQCDFGHAERGVPCK